MSTDSTTYFHLNIYSLSILRNLFTKKVMLTELVRFIFVRYFASRTLRNYRVVTYFWCCHKACFVLHFWCGRSRLSVAGFCKFSTWTFPFTFKKITIVRFLLLFSKYIFSLIYTTILPASTTWMPSSYFKQENALVLLLQKKRRF